MMKIIPQEVLNRFNAQLIKAGVPPKDHTFFKKWLRYYVENMAKALHCRLLCSQVEIVEVKRV